MRKTVITADNRAPSADDAAWLDLDKIASVEVSSEDAGHPIEAALVGTSGGGWRASESGRQTIRLRFDSPQSVQQVRVRFEEREQVRTHEFVLRATTSTGTSRDVVRQQYTFSPPETSVEVEDYRVELADVVTLELEMTPDISGGPVRASLTRLWLA